MNGPDIRVGIVTVTYGNRSNTLLRSVKSILGQGDWRSVAFLVVVDNGSTEAARRHLKVAFRDCPIPAHLISLSENRGSAFGFGRGIEEALSPRLREQIDYVLLLDDDNVLEPGALRALRGAAETYGEDSVLSAFRVDRSRLSRLVEKASDEREHPNEFLGFSVPSLIDRVTPRSAPWRNRGQFNFTPRDACKDLRLMFAPYGGMFLPKRVVVQVGLPNTRFFLDRDDHEYSLRIRQAGFRILLVCQSRVSDVDDTEGQSGDIRSKRSPRIWIAAGPKRIARLRLSARNDVHLSRRRLGRRSVVWVTNVAAHSILLFSYAVACSLASGRWTPLRSFLANMTGLVDGLRGVSGPPARFGDYPSSICKSDASI